MTILPMADAVDRISSLTPIGSVLRTAEWAEMPLELRESAYFSAGVESARLLSAQQRLLTEELQMLKRDFGRGERGIDREMFVQTIRALGERLGVRPADERDRGTLRDPISRRRLELIHRMQTEKAFSYGQWKSGQSANLLDRWPCQELIRLTEAKVPRPWPARWRAKGGRFFGGGRMIARKDSPIWAAISRFGSPIPPYDFNSGMDVIEIDRDEAVALGVIGEEEQVQPLEENLLENLEAGAAGISDDVFGALQDVFNTPGDRQIDKGPDGRIVWNRDRATSPESRDDLQQDFREEAGSLFSRVLEGFEELRSGDGTSGLAHSMDERTAAEEAGQITSAALGRKPLFHEDFGDDREAALLADRLRADFRDFPTARVEADGTDLFVWDSQRNPKPFEKIRERAHSGRELGYGVEALGDHDVAKVSVEITDQSGNYVSGFVAPLEFGGVFAAARAKDFSDATGEPHTYTLRRIGK